VKTVAVEVVAWSATMPNVAQLLGRFLTVADIVLILGLCSRWPSGTGTRRHQSPVCIFFKMTVESTAIASELVGVSGQWAVYCSGGVSPVPVPM
jgi:hypothetical protein